MIYVKILLPCGRIQKFSSCDEIPEIVRLLAKFKDPNLRYDVKDCPHYQNCGKGEKR